MKKEILWLGAIIISFWTAAAVFGQTNYGQTASTPANSWAVKMFTEAGTVMDHNFGDLALHAEAEHRFLFRNLYKEDVEIANTQSSCGCTEVKYSKKIIKTGETAEIIAKVDTSGKVHVGKRKVTVTVFFKKPYFAEVQLHVQSVIRSDVVFEPGVVEFGGISQGDHIVKKVYLQYNGVSPNWRVTGLKKTSSAVRAEAKLVKRQNNSKTYEVKVELLESAEPGYVNDLLHFVTNDSGVAGSVFIPIHGLVFEPLSVKPSYLQFGVVHPGESVRQNMVIRGSMPFKIEKISSTDSRMQFKTANQASIVHVIPITFSADTASDTGEFRQNITIKTSLKELPDLTIDAYGVISEKEKPADGAADSTDSSISNNSETYVRRTLASWKEHRSQTDSLALGGFDGVAESESQMAELLIGKTAVSAPASSTSVADLVVSTDSENPAIPGFTDRDGYLNNQKSVSIQTVSEKSFRGIRDSSGNLRTDRKTTKRSLAPQAIELTEKSRSDAAEETRDEGMSTSKMKKTTFKASRPISRSGKTSGPNDNSRDATGDPVGNSELSLTLSETEKTNMEQSVGILSESVPVTELEKESSSIQKVQDSSKEEGWFAVPVGSKRSRTEGMENGSVSGRFAMRDDLLKGMTSNEREGDRLKFRKPIMK